VAFEPGRPKLTGVAAFDHPGAARHAAREAETLRAAATAARAAAERDRRALELGDAERAALRRRADEAEARLLAATRGAAHDEAAACAEAALRELGAARLNVSKGA